MSAFTNEELETYFKSGVLLGATHMFVLRVTTRSGIGTEEYNDHYCYVLEGQSVYRTIAKRRRHIARAELLALYDLGQPAEPQLAMRICLAYPDTDELVLMQAA